MLKVLKIKVDGYKLLEDNFELDLTTKARVYNDDTNKEIIPIVEGLYTFKFIIIRIKKNIRRYYI